MEESVDDNDVGSDHDEHDDESLKVAKRRERNKELARKSRQKKKMELEQLHSKVSLLMVENGHLADQVRGLQQALNKACQQGGVHLDAVANNSLMQDPVGNPKSDSNTSTTKSTPASTVNVKRTMTDPSPPLPSTPNSTWSVSPPSLSPSLSPRLAPPTAKIHPQPLSLSLHPPLSSSSASASSTNPISLPNAQKQAQPPEQPRVASTTLGNFPLAQQLQPTLSIHTNPNNCGSSTSSNSSNSSRTSNLASTATSSTSSGNFDLHNVSPMDTQEDPDLHAALVLADLFKRDRQDKYNQEDMQPLTPSAKHPRLLLDVMRQERSSFTSASNANNPQYRNHHMMTRASATTHE